MKKTKKKLKYVRSVDLAAAAHVSLPAITSAVRSGKLVKSGPSSEFDVFDKVNKSWLEAHGINPADVRRTDAPRGRTGRPSRGEDSNIDLHKINLRLKNEKLQLDLEIKHKKFLPTEFIEDVYITYLEKFNSTVERFSATFIRDIGKKILEAGEILPEHIEAFTNEILNLTHENKKQVWERFKDYEPK